MPTYSYQCRRCGNIQDIFHGMSATPLIKCAECGGACTKLLGTGAGIIFKGSGFYETDYKKKGKSPAAESASAVSPKESKPASDKASKAGSSTDAKSSTAAKAG